MPSLGEKVKNTFIEAFREMSTDLQTFFEELVPRMFGGIAEQARDKVEEVTEGLAEPFGIPNLPETLKIMTTNEKVGLPTFNRRVVELVESLLVRLWLWSHRFKARGILAEYQGAKDNPVARFDPAILGQLIAQRPDLFDTFFSDLEDLGYDKDHREALRTLMWNGSYMDVQSSIAWWLRKGADNTKWNIDAHLQEKGLNPASVSALKEMAWVIPPIQDLIRMAVKEAFDDRFAEDWGTDQQFEKMPVEEAKKLGLSEYWQKYIWRAHWELPSVQMGFEMLHRGVISQEQLLQLMTALDIMPGWRQPLIDISYNPDTRVDIRRMHAVGLMSEDDLVRAYKDIGASPERAERMKNFTLKYNARKEKDLTTSQILKRLDYRPGEVATVQGMLTSIGWDDFEANWLIEERMFEKEEEHRTLATGALKKIWQKFPIEHHFVSDQLDELGYDQEGKDALFLLWDSEKEPPKRNPTKADLLRWLGKGTIDPQRFIWRMESLGFQDEDIGFYLKEKGYDPTLFTFGGIPYKHRTTTRSVKMPGVFALPEEREEENERS